jgi:hypothetical protein
MFCDSDVPGYVVDDLKFIGDGYGNTRTINGWIVNGAWTFSYDSESGDFSIVEHNDEIVAKILSLQFIEIPKEIYDYNSAFDWWHDGIPPIVRNPQKFNDEFWDDDIPF